MSYNNNNRRSFSGSKPRPSNNQFRRPSRSGGGNRRSKQNINTNLFINKAIKSKEEDVYEPTHKFSDFDFHQIVQNNITEAGFETPSAIQDQTIPLAMQDKDVIGLANTGTGKTAAFLLPVLNKLYTKRTTNSVLIIAPTRELAQQIDAEFKRFSTDMKVYSAVCVGGVNIGGQIRQIRRNPHVIIGTPGRLKDLMEQRILNLESINTLILDEADRMLDMGFINDIKFIMAATPKTRQTLCFSATMSEGVKSIMNEFMISPELVSVKKTENNDHIYQDVISYRDDEDKKLLLIDILQKPEFSKVIVFGETKFGVQRLSDRLEASGITARAIHGNKNQGQRNRALESFKSNSVKVLVATDVAARGLDIPNVSHVINFDQPQSYEDYIHRIGRTGRGGKSGTAFTFIKG